MSIEELRKSRIYHGDKPTPALDLVKWCEENKLAVQFNPSNKEKGKLLTANVNLHTKAREEKLIPLLYAKGWKLYHYPPSNSIHKYVSFMEVSL